MFTAENFRRIYDNENRKGLDLASRYFPELEPYTLAVHKKTQEIRELRAKKATLKAENFSTQQATLKDELARLKAKKLAAIDDAMEEISRKVLQSNFNIDLAKKSEIKGKDIFCIDARPETFFVIKQLQRNINRIYKVKQANRHDLVCQLRDVVRTKFPFELVRTDISRFYESINRKRLIDMLDSDQLLSPFSKKYIKQVLDSYGVISGEKKGVPRGVGISAYLAELYLRPVDRAIRSIPGLVLYCRFVDDIVVVFARPPVGKDLGSYKDQIAQIFSNNELTCNTKKTFECNLADTKIKEFEYLGYRFVLQPGLCQIHLSSAKIDKYKARIESIFSDYDHQCHLNSRRAFRDLVARVKFLTGNTRLSNSKSNTVTGIYYNNSIITDTSSLEPLDKLLKARIATIKRPSLRQKLKNYKFEEGFLTRRFHNFSAQELQTIVRAWKNG